MFQMQSANLKMKNFRFCIVILHFDIYIFNLLWADARIWTEDLRLTMALLYRWATSAKLITEFFVGGEGLAPPKSEGRRVYSAVV